MECHVTWKIDIEAKSFKDAAKIAQQIQRDPNSLATHFIVECESGERMEVWTDSKHSE